MLILYKSIRLKVKITSYTQGSYIQDTGHFKKFFFFLYLS